MNLILLIVSSVVSTLAVDDGLLENALDAREGDFPHITLIEVLHPHTGRFMSICAGSIISEYDVLTNAICASACQHPPNCRIYAGRVNVDVGGIELEIIKTKWHESYNEMDLMRGDPYVREKPVVDFGIIHTKKIPLSDTINIIALADRAHINYEYVIIAGWGGEINGFFIDEPKQQRVLKYGNTSAFICRSDNSKEVICVSYHGEARPCISDMGASLTYPDKNQLAGVGDWFSLLTCGGTFNRVFVHLDWIKDNMCNDCGGD